jgi:uncharacterized membrane protein
MIADSPSPDYRRYFSALAFAALAFLALDAVWLTTMASRLYRPEIGHVMREDFDAWAAAAFYAVYLCGMVGFVVMPATSGRGAAMRGALFGLVAYATYDLTNQATIRNWSWTVTLADLCWGTFATACAAAVAFRATSRRTR